MFLFIGAKGRRFYCVQKQARVKGKGKILFVEYRSRINSLKVCFPFSPPTLAILTVFLLYTTSICVIVISLVLYPFLFSSFSSSPSSLLLVLTVAA